MASRGRQFTDSIYEQISRIGKACSSPKRLELLGLLCQGPRTVEALADQAGLGLANASQHLQILRAARLVETEKRGVFVEYRVAEEQVYKFFHVLCGLADARLFAYSEPIGGLIPTALGGRFRADPGVDSEAPGGPFRGTRGPIPGHSGACSEAPGG